MWTSSSRLEHAQDERPDLLKAVRANTTGPRIPVLMVTAEANKDNIVQAARLAPTVTSSSPGRHAAREATRSWGK